MLEVDSCILQDVVDLVLNARFQRAAVAPDLVQLNSDQEKSQPRTSFCPRNVHDQPYIQL
jgi:hypothetical protein